MTFVNEIISDADIDRYLLPFPKGQGHFWTRDIDQDVYLWGGKGGNPAFGDPITGCFHLYIRGKNYVVSLAPGEGSISYGDDPFVVVWSSILSVSPSTLPADELSELIHVLKTALVVYGEDGRGSRFAVNPIVLFEF